MRMGKHIGLLLVILVALGNGPRAWAQGKAQPQGWQGPRPAPQQPTPLPALQAPVPSGKQVLELPSHPQPSTLELPTQQSVIPPNPQPTKARPSQLVTVTV